MRWDNPPISWFAKVPVIIDRILLETLDKGGPREIDAFLLPEIHRLHNHYIQTGNPRIIYLAGSSVADHVNLMRGCRYSFQFSRLQAFLAEMLLTQGKDADMLQKAINHLEIALETINRVPTISDDIVRAHVSYALFLGVTRKALGNFDGSIKGMRATAKYLITKNSATEVELIQLRRQEIMMHQTVAGHRKLAEDAVRYHVLRPLEYYRSLKRVFEFLLNKGGVQEAEQIYPEFKRAFAASAKQLAPISHVSFLKNVGQYLMAKGDAPAAASVFNRSLLEASHRNLYGQVRQLKRLMQELEAGDSQGQLVTFKVESTRST